MKTITQSHYVSRTENEADNSHNPVDGGLIFNRNSADGAEAIDTKRVMPERSRGRHSTKIR